MADDTPPGGNREDDLTAWLAARLGDGHLLGDDAAVLPQLSAGGRWVATVDSQIAGVHHPQWLPEELAARRLLAVNLSDLAAMGAEPRYGLLALSGPVGEGGLDREAYFEGLLAACGEWGVVLAGGDLARTSETRIGSLTLLGELPDGRQPLRRDAAKPGQAIWVSGELGESAAGRLLLERGARVERAGGRGSESAETEPEGRKATQWPLSTEQISKGEKGEERSAESGLERGGAIKSRWRIHLPDELPSALAAPARRAIWRHLDPQPELALGRRLAEAGAPGAAMDLSDGLATDLPRLCRASGVGAEIDATALPASPDFDALCAWLDADPLHMALSGGEDYSLLLTLPTDLDPPPSCTQIGQITPPPHLRLLTPQGPRPFPTGGWDHLTS